MRPKEVKQIINKAVEDPVNTPPIMLWGPPGVGKSSIVFQVTEERGIGFLDIRLAQRDPTDLCGIPVPEDGHAKWLQPAELPRDGRGIMILDELPSAPPLVQVSAYQLTFDGKIGEYELPEGWYIVCAGNRVQDRAVVHRMSSALNNRLIHIDFEANVQDWTEWALGVGLDPNIIAFIQWRGDDLLFKFNPESEEKAFPSPRTWEFASQMLKICPKSLLPEVLEGTIGKGATAEFTGFLKVQTELPDLNEIFEGKDIVPKKMDLRYALISALVSRAKNAKQFNRLIEYSMALPAEYSVMLVQLLASKNRGLVATSVNFKKWSRAHSEIAIDKKMI